VYAARGKRGGPRLNGRELRLRRRAEGYGYVRRP